MHITIEALLASDYLSPVNSYLREVCRNGKKLYFLSVIMVQVLTAWKLEELNSSIPREALEELRKALIPLFPSLHPGQV